MPKIGKKSVDAAKPKQERFYVWDTDLKGFGLLVLPSGVKSYVLRYRTAEGVDRRATIGKHGALTPDEARRRAEEMRRVVRAGGDPLTEKNALRQAPTVAAMLDAYVLSERFARKADKTQATDRGRIERHLKPILGRRHVHKLTPGEVERAFAAIRDGKTAADVKTGPRGRARVTGGAGTARMAIALLRAALGWAEREGLAASNPARMVEIGTSGERTVILEDAAAYGRLFETLDRMQHELRLRPAAADAIRLIALTGARRGEITGLLWEYVDLKKGVITLPPTAHKSGRKTGKPRVIGLPSAAQAIIARQPAGRPEDFVFRPARGEGPLALAKPWRAVRVEAALPQDIGLHALRHSLASHMAMRGAEAAEIMTALGHRQLSTAQKYIHWAQDARQALAERAAGVVLAGAALAGQAAQERRRA